MMDYLNMRNFCRFDDLNIKCAMLAMFCICVWLNSNLYLINACSCICGLCVFNRLCGFRNHAHCISKEIVYTCPVIVHWMCAREI